MLPPFDIFRLEPKGDMLWVKSADDWKSARIAVRELMSYSPDDYLIHSHRTNNGLIVRHRPPSTSHNVKPIFQIAYDETLMESRAGLLKARGFEVVSVLGNEAATTALANHGDYLLFIIAHAAKPSERTEMAEWLKRKHPKIPILALNPPYQQELKPADYNIILNGPEEWLFIVEAAAA